MNRGENRPTCRYALLKQYEGLELAPHLRRFRCSPHKRALPDEYHSGYFAIAPNCDVPITVLGIDSLYVASPYHDPHSGTADGASNGYNGEMETTWPQLFCRLSAMHPVVETRFKVRLRRKADRESRNT